jgi:hypothetical protein
VALTELNINDVNKLSQLRMERLVGFFAISLSCCSMYINANNTLIINCLDLNVMKDLSDGLDELFYYAYLILGVRSLAIHLSEKEVLQAKTNSPLQE